MIQLKTTISLLNIAWVEEFCNIALKEFKFEISQYDKVIEYGAERNVLIKIYTDQESFDKMDIMLSLRSGLTLLGHINIYCEHHPCFWNKEEKYEYFNK